MRWIAYDAHVGIAIEPIGGHYLHRPRVLGRSTRGLVRKRLKSSRIRPIHTSQATPGEYRVGLDLLPSVRPNGCGPPRWVLVALSPDRQVRPVRARTARAPQGRDVPSTLLEGLQGRTGEVDCETIDEFQAAQNHSFWTSSRPAGVILDFLLERIKQDVSLNH